MDDTRLFQTRSSSNFLLSSFFSLLFLLFSVSLRTANIKVITRVSNTCNQNINTNRYKVLYACISIFLAHHFPSNRAFCLFWNWDNPVVTRRSDRAKKLQVYRGEMISFERETGQVEKSAILSGDNFRRRKHGENPSSADRPGLPLPLDRRPDIRRRAGNEIIAWNKRGNNFMPPRRLRRVAAPSRSIACLGHGCATIYFPLRYTRYTAEDCSTTGLG